MNIKTKLASLFIVFSFVGTTLFATLPAYAADGSSSGNFFSGLVQFISQKLGLDQSKVQAVVNDYHAQKVATRPAPTLQQFQSKEKTRLDRLVSQGKITSDQETAILNELTTIYNKYNLSNLKNLTQDQRRQQFENMQNDINAWAKDNNISPQYVMPFGPIGMGMHRGWMRMHDNDQDNTTPTPGS